MKVRISLAALAMTTLVAAGVVALVVVVVVLLLLPQPAATSVVMARAARLMGTFIGTRTSSSSVLTSCWV